MTAKLTAHELERMVHERVHGRGEDLVDVLNDIAAGRATFEREGYYNLAMRLHVALSKTAFKRIAKQGEYRSADRSFRFYRSERTPALVAQDVARAKLSASVAEANADRSGGARSGSRGKTDLWDVDMPQRQADGSWIDLEDGLPIDRSLWPALERGQY